MPRLFLAFLGLAVLSTSASLAGATGIFRTNVEPLRSTRSSFPETEVKIADLGTRLDT